MSFRGNDASMSQTSMLDTTSLMSDREKRFLEKSWAKVFAEEIFPKIDEQAFAPMYSSVDSRPNTPVNVTVGALLLKELNGMSDDDILESMMFDVRFKVALHTTGMVEQPMSDRTLGRFRARCEAYGPFRIPPANLQTELVFPGYADTASTGHCPFPFRLSSAEIVRHLFVVAAPRETITVVPSSYNRNRSKARLRPGCIRGQNRRLRQLQPWCNPDDTWRV